MKIAAEVYWDRGMRETNQDSVSLQEVRIGKRRAVFALVCDGIGGLQEGETASGLVAERMTQWFYEEGIGMLKARKSRGKIKKSGLRALYSCSESLKEYGYRQNIKLGTTVTMLLLWEERYILWHSGDTRAYCFKGRRRQMRQLTIDHTAGRHALIQCIGSFPWSEPQVGTGTLRGSSILLLCSDGFYRQIHAKRLEEALQPVYLTSGEQIRICLRELAQYAKRQGERDNLSAVAVRIN